jgi:hypothetical protein
LLLGYSIGVSKVVVSFLSGYSFGSLNPKVARFALPVSFIVIGQGFFFTAHFALFHNKRITNNGSSIVAEAISKPPAFWARGKRL